MACSADMMQSQAHAFGSMKLHLLVLLIIHALPILMSSVLDVLPDFCNA